MTSRARRRDTVGELRIERVAIEELKLDPRNPRLHGDRQIKQIARSIKAFGFNVPVLADQDSNILAGHGRVHGARRLGLREIPVIRLEHLTREQARAFNRARSSAAAAASHPSSCPPLPVARKRCDHFTTLATLTPNSVAVARHVRPLATEPTTRSRRSLE